MPTDSPACHVSSWSTCPGRGSQLPRETWYETCHDFMTQLLWMVFVLLCFESIFTIGHVTLVAITALMGLSYIKVKSHTSLQLDSKYNDCHSRNYVWKFPVIFKPLAASHATWMCYLNDFNESNIVATVNSTATQFVLSGYAGDVRFQCVRIRMMYSEFLNMTYMHTLNKNVITSANGRPF